MALILPPVKKIEVILDRQVLLAYDSSGSAVTFDCVSGDSVHPTPKGKWEVLHKHRYYTSRKYKVRMDYAMFFTTTGEAIHESMAVGLLSYMKFFGIDSIGSHGCVRLASSDAEILFKATHLKTP